MSGKVTQNWLYISLNELYHNKKAFTLLEKAFYYITPILLKGIAIT